jgi:glycosyltransferase involved in cell wall biosynthesis
VEQRPTVSIILPTYNVEKMVELTLASICSQAYRNFELIVVDGKSNDKTLDVITSYQKQQGNCSWISEQDRGLYDAMNKGIKRARGQWLYFIGAGDAMIDCLDQVVPFLLDQNTIYYGDVYLPSKNKTYAGEYRWHTLVSRNINHQSIFYPRGVFDTYSYNLKYRILADYELNLRCWGEGHFQFRYIPVLVAIHNENGLSHHEIDEAFEEDKPGLVARYFGRRMKLRATWLSAKNAFGKIWRAGSAQD